MSREGALLVMIAVAVLLIGLMLWGWRRRTRRDAALVAPTSAIAGVERYQASGLYVATTAHDDALNRLAIKHLAYRARVTVTVLDDGVRLALTGEPTVSIPRTALVSVGTATVTIDKVVERDGLVRLVWLIAPGQPVDSYVRLQQTSPQELIAAIDSLIPAPASTGTEA